MKNYIVTVVSENGVYYVNTASWAEQLQVQIHYRGMGFTTSVASA